MTFGVYVHVPFCRTRCGYCDFTTYAPGELEGATPDGYVEAALREMRMARLVLGEALSDIPRADTVYFGGGTPTMLSVTSLARLMGGVREAFGIQDGAEATVEANPDSVTAESFAGLAEAGFTRVSLGMQSAVPSVLATLDRTHRPANVGRAVGWAKAVGLDVSLDLIYGTPGETLGDWRASVDAALALEPDHMSAYALVIEPRTRMGAAQARGEIAPVDPDLQADMYEAADTAFARAGYEWYEVSNWAREDRGDEPWGRPDLESRDHRCRHNLGYWTGGDWWGIGPGAHSHLAGRGGRPATRWWNVKHPLAYAKRIARGESPEEGREVLDADQAQVERILLGVRLREGLDSGLLGREGRASIPGLVEDGLIERGEGRGPSAGGAIVLTRRGRLLADAVVRALT